MAQRNRLFQLPLPRLLRRLRLRRQVVAYDLQLILAARQAAPVDPLDRKLQLYNPLDDTRRLKAAPENFEQLRGSYPLRRERWD